MTLEDLLNINPSEIDSLTADQLINICKPYWTITRPELAKVEKVKAPVKPVDKEKHKQIEMAKALARQMGINLK